MVCLGVVVLYVLVAAGGLAYELLAAHASAVKARGQTPRWDVPEFEDTQDFAHTNEAPALGPPRGLLGTDWSGKSVLFKTLLGAKVSITVGFLANILAVPLGMLLAMVSLLLAFMFRVQADTDIEQLKVELDNAIGRQNALVESIEWPDHQWGIGVQFHPEFTSKPMSPQPLFVSFVSACINYEKK